MLFFLAPCVTMLATPVQVMPPWAFHPEKTLPKSSVRQLMPYLIQRTNPTTPMMTVSPYLVDDEMDFK
jgi:hypothetical protein